MSKINPFSVKKIINDMIKEIIRLDYPQFKLFRITDIPSQTDGKITQYKASIKDPNSKLAYDNVPMLGIGLSNLNGIVKYPKDGDYVLVGFIGEQPFIIGTLFDSFSQTPDNIPPIKQGETLIVGKEAGQTIFMNEDGDIILKTPEGGKVSVNNNGVVRVENSNGSFQLDAAGTLTVNDAFTFPLVDGSNGQVLKTNGSGTLSWQNDIDT